MQYFTWTKRHQLSEIQLNDNNNILANVIKLDICVVCSIGFYNISFAIWSEWNVQFECDIWLDKQLDILFVMASSNTQHTQTDT